MNIFDKTGGLRPGRSVFDLSYSKLFDTYSGKLIPIMCDEVVPGDFWDIGNEVVVRLQPLVGPAMHEIDIYVHYFFAPYRVLDPNFEEFITGGVDGQSTVALPRWQPTATPTKGSLWDYMGFPLVRTSDWNAPILYPALAYYFIWNEYYRDQTLQAKVDLSAIAGSEGVIKYRDWRKDYFTSALPWQQRGTAPALPITGIGHALWPDADFGAGGLDLVPAAFDKYSTPNKSINNIGGNAQSIANMKAFFADNTVDLSTATSVTISELRLSVQIQKWLERNARGGSRYTEFLTEHFGVSPRDDRLQRPEYIGGSKQPVIISEVLKTSQDGTRPQGNLAGHGLSASAAKCARYKATEFGLIMGLMSIMPAPLYNSQGFDRQFLRRSKLDFYFPEFAHLSEQAIENEEIFCTGVNATDRTIFGYQQRYAELRMKRSGTANNMRDTLAYYHMARKFASQPALNDAFVTCNGERDDAKSIFAVPSEPGYIVHFGNKIKAVRPLPIMAEPGLMDHF